MQDFVPQLYILRRNTLDRFDGRIIAQTLLRRPLGPADRALLEECPLLGMMEEGQGAITQQVDGGLVAGQQQQGTVHQHLMPGEYPSFLTAGHHGNEIVSRIVYTLCDQRGQVLEHALHACGLGPQPVGGSLAPGQKLLG
jgi:hypothetical protein